jgi:hypothetical protein
MQNSNSQFIHGLELNNGFYHDIVKPLLNKAYPRLPYSASLLGYGSDVMGFDTETSMDHNWGPRMQIFIDDHDLIPQLDAYFSLELPFQYKGFSVNFTDPRYDKTQSMELTDKKPIRHLIEIMTFEDYLINRYSIHGIGNFSNQEWMTFRDQQLLEITAGEVFYDGLNKLNKTRKELMFYPMDIGKLRLATLWHYISNKEAFIGRSIALNDFIGLKINVTRIINYLIKIMFYLEGKYIPYSKWFGTSFGSLKSFGEINGTVKDVLSENRPEMIEEKLCTLYTLVIEKHNKVSGMPHLTNSIRNYFNRPYRVIFSENIIEEIRNSIEDQAIKNVDIRKYGYDIIIDE